MSRRVLKKKLPIFLCNINVNSNVRPFTIDLLCEWSIYSIDETNLDSNQQSLYPVPLTFRTSPTF